MMGFDRIRRTLVPNTGNVITNTQKIDPQDAPIVCVLQGGMGNQMFQYAMAKNMSAKLGVPLLLNTLRFNSCMMRQYSLGLWKGVTEQIVDFEPNRVLERGMPYNKMIQDQIKPGSSIIGYWQTEKYFLEIKDQLQDIFLPKQELTQRGNDTLDKIIAAGDRSVFLTVRRTDYVNSDFHNVLSKDYYDNALRIITNEIPDPVIFIFSDEPEWCKENMNLEYETYIGGNYDMTTKTHLGREDEELFLMMNCKHAILANSSYSWWGAWLSKNPGIRVTPIKWFESTKEDSRDIIPYEWIKI